MNHSSAWPPHTAKLPSLSPPPLLDRLRRLVRQAARLVCIAAAVELMCEPLVLIFQYRLLVGVRGQYVTEPTDLDEVM